MDQIALFFKCQSCSDYVLTGNIQCPSGHQVCQACFENLSHCPTCNQRVAPSTRIPFLLTANVDPILNVGESFDLLLPSLLRLAPVLSPCGEDEMIFTGKSNLICNSALDNDSSMQQNNNLADQLLMATSNCEVEETLSRLMMLASMSPGPSQSIIAGGNNRNNNNNNNDNNNNNNNSTVPPPGLISSASANL